MLDYIKKQLAERVEQNVQESAKIDPADVSPEMIMEYAPIMEALDDLSIMGTEAPNEARSLVSIPINDETDEEIDNNAVEKALAGNDPLNDAEISNIEIDGATGTLAGIPLDAAIAFEYATMKTKDSFIQESYANIDPEKGMTIAEYDAKVADAAQQVFLEYRAEVLNKEKHGFKKVPMDNINVFSSYLLEFFNENTTLLEPNYQVDINGNVRKKQIESLRVMGAGGHTAEPLQKFLEGYMLENYYTSNLELSLQPVSLNVPIDPIDKHSIIVGFKNMANLGQMEYVRCSVPVLEAFAEPTFEIVPASTIEKMNQVSCTKIMAYQESMSEHPQYHHRIIMEGINFGDSAPADGDAPTIDASNPPAADASASTDAGATEGADAKATIPVQVNNVSDQIAEKVSANNSVPTESQSGEQTANAIDNVGSELDAATSDATPQPALDAGATPAPDITAGTDAGAVDSSNDIEGASEAGTGDDIESQLNALDDIAGENKNADDMTQLTAGADMGASDMSNLSMEDMISQATDKIKTMPIGQLQKFLSGAVQEGFVQEAAKTKGATMNEKVDLGIRECLGILNDDKLSFKGITENFGKAGKAFNKTLTAAAKSKDYSAEEVGKITELNKSLTDLLVHFKPKDKASVEEVKGYIRSFTKAADGVTNIIERHKKADAAGKDE